MNQTNDKTLAELEKDLGAAIENHKAARQEESAARSAATSALNRLNQAQKALDDRLAKMRAEAAGESDWANYRRQSVPAAARGEQGR